MNEVLYFMLRHVFVWIFLGIVLGRWFNLKERLAQRLLVWAGVRITIPVMIFCVVLQHFPVSEAKNIIYLILAAFGFVASSYGFSLILYKTSRSEVDQGSWSLTCSIHNYGFTAVAIVQSLFSPETLSQLLIFVIAVEWLLWTWGLGLIRKGGARWKSLLSPPAMALVSSLLLRFFAPIDLNEYTFGRSLIKVGDCAVPIALTFIGTITYHSFINYGTEYFRNKTVWLSLAFRHVWMPAFLLSCCYLLIKPGAVQEVVMIEAIMPMALMPIAMIAIYGRDLPIFATAIILSNCLSFVTIPIWLMVCKLLFKI